VRWLNPALSRLDIERQLKLGRLQNGQMGWAGTFKDPPDIDATLIDSLKHLIGLDDNRLWNA